MVRAAGLVGAPQASSEIAAVLSDLVSRRWGSPAGRRRPAGEKPVRPVLPGGSP